MFAKKYIANDGHKCNSFSEKIIDDWFYARGIKHEINYPYREDDGFTADFKVGDFWIEFFGLSRKHKRYDQLKKQNRNIDQLRRDLRAARVLCPQSVELKALAGGDSLFPDTLSFAF